MTPAVTVMFAVCLLALAADVAILLRIAEAAD